MLEKEDRQVKMKQMMEDTMSVGNMFIYKLIFLDLRKKINKSFQKKKSFGTWSDEEESDGEEITNMCFLALGECDNNKSDNEENANLCLMAIGENSKGILCHICNELQEFIDLSLIDIEKVLYVLQKIQREKRNGN